MIRTHPDSSSGCLKWLEWERAASFNRAAHCADPWVQEESLQELVDPTCPTRFSTGKIPTKRVWASVMLLPMPDGGVRVIGLLNVVWKVITSTIDRRASQNIQYHDAIHGF